jgi:hypothetical protein
MKSGATTMANNGNEWIDYTFNQCVYLLVDLARLFGITYEAINIWIFVVAWPLYTLFVMWLAFKFWRESRKLKMQLSA